MLNDRSFPFLSSLMAVETQLLPGETCLSSTEERESKSFMVDERQTFLAGSKPEIDRQGQRFHVTNLWTSFISSGISAEYFLD